MNGVQTYQLFGKSTKGRSANVTSQRRINLYAEPGDDKGEFVLYSRPGTYRKYFTAPFLDSLGGPLRGAVWTNAGLSSGGSAYCAQGKQFGVALTLERFLMTPEFGETSNGPVQIASIGSAVVAVDGVTGYLPSLGQSLPDYGVTDFPAASSICTLGQRFIVNDPAYVGRFRWSDIGSDTSWPALNYATAESNEDPLQLVYSTRGELLLFGASSIEFWSPSSDANLPFTPVSGATAQWGLGAFDTVRDVGGKCFFLGKAAGSGQVQVCALDGYQVQVVSTPDIDTIIAQQLALNANACATPVQFAGHQWYVVNLATTSLAFDLTSGVWCEWQTEGSRWCGQYTFTYKGFTFITDYRDSRIYVLDDSVYADDSAAMVREIVSRHTFDQLNRLTLWEVMLDVETGVGTAQAGASGSTPEDTTGPQIMLQISRDGGHTFGNEIWTSLGWLGKYLQRVVWRRLGRGRDFVFRFRVSDPVKVVIIGASVRAE